MSKFYIQTKCPEDWGGKLANNNRQWKDGFSAKSLAYCWEEQKDFPLSVKNSFKNSIFEGMEMLFAFPEYKVALPGGGHASQNDLFVIGKVKVELVTVMVEGKVQESFGEKVSKWLGDNPSKGKNDRLDYLLTLLNLQKDKVLDIRYQLLHRTVSAMIEAEKLNAKKAIMLVHSFSKESKWFEDYVQFLQLYKLSAEKDSVIGPLQINGLNLYFCWVRGEKL